MFTIHSVSNFSLKGVRQPMLPRCDGQNRR